MEHGKYDGITQNIVQQPQPSLTLPAAINLRPDVGLSCIALATIVALTWFIREIRLLVTAYKDS